MEKVVPIITDDELYAKSAKNILKYRIETKGVWTGYGGMSSSVLDDNTFLTDWGKKNLVPVLPKTKEIIPRESWDLPGLSGATEFQMYHPHFDILKNYFYENYKPKHDTCVFMLCTNKKPYEDSYFIKQYYKTSKPYADLLILSNPGVIPIEYSNYYPFRYYEWPENEETPEIKIKYIQMIKDRVEDWFKHFPQYKSFISLVRPGGPGEETQQALMTLNSPVKSTHIFNDTWQKEASVKYPQLKKGLLKVRALNIGYTREKFLGALEQEYKRSLEKSTFQFGGM